MRWYAGYHRDYWHLRLKDGEWQLGEASSGHLKGAFYVVEIGFEKGTFYPNEGAADPETWYIINLDTGSIELFSISSYTLVGASVSLGFDLAGFLHAVLD